jgi:hypothetical protein
MCHAAGPPTPTHHPSQTHIRTAHLQAYADDHIIVAFETGVKTIASATEKMLGVRYARTVGSHGARVYHVTDGDSVENKLQQFKELPGAQRSSVLQDGHALHLPTHAPSYRLVGGCMQYVSYVSPNHSA